VRHQSSRHLRATCLGVAAGIIGTTAMDLVEFRRYRASGGTRGLVKWETSAGVNGWADASAPGQFGKWVVETATRRDPSDRWARTLTNLVHWATGIGWAVQFGFVSDSERRRHQFLLGALLGPTAWASGYAILPLTKVYKLIWDYDRTTLAKDFRTHLVYGCVTAVSFALLNGSTGIEGGEHA
jgi:hypothetical protein